MDALASFRPYADQFHIVLVSPQESLNVGSVARAMMNLGFRHLHLVAPRGYDFQRAAITACWATSVLDNLTIHDTFAQAIGDMEEVIGFSGRVAGNPRCVSLPVWASDLGKTIPPRTALVFGTEDDGLNEEYVRQCGRIVQIPATTENPSYNLSQAVLLALYEISRVYTEPDLPDTYPHPTQNDFYQLDRLLTEAMAEGRFVRSGSPTPAPDRVRSLFRRFDLTQDEMHLLLALFGRINSTLRHYKLKSEDNLEG